MIFLFLRGCSKNLTASVFWIGLCPTRFRFGMTPYTRQIVATVGSPRGIFGHIKITQKNRETLGKDR